MTQTEVFTVLRMEDHRVPLFALHVDRLFWGFRVARWERPPTRKEIAGDLFRVLPDLPPGSLRVRVVFTPRGPQVTWQPVERAPDWTFRTAIPIPFSAFKRWKVGDWTAYREAQKQARDRGYDEALLIRGEEVISLARANLVAFVEGRWITPRAREATCGVMRRFLCRMLRATPHPLVFRRLTMADLERAGVVAGVNAVRLFLPLAVGEQDMALLQKLWEAVRPAFEKTRVEVS